MYVDLGNPAEIDNFKVRLNEKLEDAHRRQIEIGDEKVACRIVAVGRWIEAEIVRTNDDRMKAGERIELQFWDGKGADGATWEPMYVDKRRAELVTKVPHGVTASGFLMLEIDRDGELKLNPGLMNI